MICHLSGGDPDLPDAGGGMCCIGSAVYGPRKCTCWTDVYDLEQAEPQDGPTQVRSAMCQDCAFRPDSPERAGTADFAHAGEVDEIAYRKEALFLCHQGVRRRVAMVHPSGARVELPPHAYAPGGSYDRPCKLDGTPQDICAGFWTARRAIDAEFESEVLEDGTAR